MDQTIERFYQRIGEEALAIAEGVAGRLLVYAEIEKGVVSADLFYMNIDGVVRFKFCPKPMQALIYSLWQIWKEQPKSPEWRVMAYTIDEGKFSIDLTYADQIDETEELSDRRPRAIQKYFGDAKVDYQKPR